MLCPEMNLQWFLCLTRNVVDSCAFGNAQAVCIETENSVSFYFWTRGVFAKLERSSLSPPLGSLYYLNLLFYYVVWN